MSRRFIPRGKHVTSLGGGVDVLIVDDDNNDEDAKFITVEDGDNDEKVAVDDEGDIKV